jgi:hypothetical protein
MSEYPNIPPDQECKDKTLKLLRSEENLLKRLRQIGTGSFEIILMDGEPIVLVVGGKIELLRRISLS